MGKKITAPALVCTINTTLPCPITYLYLMWINNLRDISSMACLKTKQNLKILIFSNKHSPCSHLHFSKWQF